MTQEEIEMIEGKRLLVIDDVFTTGNTLSDSAKILSNEFNFESLTFYTIFSKVKRS